MLEFSGGNRIEHLLGVFMRDQKVCFFLALLVSDLTLPKTEKVVL